MNNRSVANLALDDVEGIAHTTDIIKSYINFRQLNLMRLYWLENCEEKKTKSR